MGYSAEDLKLVPEAAILGVGCGNPTALADLKDGETVVDLGAGAGIDVFLAAHRVGSRGRVIGVDMTEDMVAKGRQLAQEHGFANVEFRLGEIERLPLKAASVDVIISNCVINLTEDKLASYREIYPGPEARRPDTDLRFGDRGRACRQTCGPAAAAWADCLAGAMEKEAYLETIRRAGFAGGKRGLRIPVWLPGAGPAAYGQDFERQGAGL